MTLGLFFLCVGSVYATGEYTLPEALDMTLSTISCCGYLGLRDHPPLGYVLLAAYTNVAVPVVAIALGE